MEVVRGVRQAHAVDDGVDAAGGGAGGARFAEIGGEDLGVRHLAECLFELLPSAADRAEGDSAPIQLRPDGTADGAGSAEDRNVPHMYQGTLTRRRKCPSRARMDKAELYATDTLKLSHDSNVIRQCRAGTESTG